MMESLAQAEWRGDTDVLHNGDKVSVLSVDIAGAERRPFLVNGEMWTPPMINGHIACWIRHWPEGMAYAMFRSCDLADLDLSERDYDRLVSLAKGQMK